MTIGNTLEFHVKELDYKPEDVNFLSSKVDELDQHLKNLVASKKLQAASYMISRDCKTFACKSMGKLRFDDAEKEFMPDSIRWIASITKAFTAVAILQLVEKGLIRLDQCVAEICAEFRNPMYDKITIFHLLTHTSGIRPDPGVFFEPFPRDWEWAHSPDWIKEILRDYLPIEPGKEWRYSSAGFHILAEIVTRVSGVHFDNYIFENITKPLGMNNTFFDVPEELAHKVCFNNKWSLQWFNDRFNRPDWDPPRGGGGLFSTLEDLQKFGQMLLNKGTLNGVRILSRKAVETMTRNQLKGQRTYCWGANGFEMEHGFALTVYSNNTFLSPGSFAHEGAGLCGLFVDPVEKLVLSYICPLGEGVDWLAEAVSNLRNIVWSGIL